MCSIGIVKITHHGVYAYMHEPKYMWPSLTSPSTTLRKPIEWQKFTAVDVKSHALHIHTHTHMHTQFTHVHTHAHAFPHTDIHDTKLRMTSQEAQGSSERLASGSPTC